MRVPLLLAGLALSAAVGGPAKADVVYLTNGSRLLVHDWREAEDALELTIAGGTVWIDKAEVIKIEEGRGGDPPLAVATAVVVEPSGGGPSPSGVIPPPAPPPPPRVRMDAAAAIHRMLALLKQGEALFADAFLSPAQKVRAVRWLDERWREFDVPEPLRHLYASGHQAVRLAGEAFAAQWEGQAEASARAAEAVRAMRGAEAALRDGRDREEDKP
jgi:hypothetical protein